MKHQTQERYRFMDIQNYEKIHILLLFEHYLRNKYELQATFHKKKN